MAQAGGALLASSHTTPAWPDMYFTMFHIDASEASAKGLETIFGVETGVLQSYLRADYGKDAFFFVSTLAVPRSRGEVKLRSTNPLDPVIIDPKYYDVPEDLQIMVEGNWSKRCRFAFIHEGSYGPNMHGMYLLQLRKLL